MLDDALNNLWLHIDTFVQHILDWFSLHIVNIVLILLGAWLVRRFSSRVINEFMRRTVRSDIYPTKSDRERRIRTLDSLINAVVRTGVYIIAGILIIGEIAPGSAAALFTSAGLIGVAIGFGAQSLVRDLVSGIFIIIENQYRIGDFVDIGGVSGTVEDITVRTTILRDLDGNVHHVPNGFIDVTTNRTIGFSRINEDLLVDAAADIDRLEHIINHVGEELANDVKFKDMIIEAPHFERILNYAPAGVTVNIRGKTTVSGKWQVVSELYKRLHKEFEKNKIKLGKHVAPPTVATKKK